MEKKRFDKRFKGKGREKKQVLTSLGLGEGKLLYKKGIYLNSSVQQDTLVNNIFMVIKNNIINMELAKN